MISDEEKRRIWEEEKYRFEVRRQLEAETPAPIKKSKIWTFLNSPFGIWLLATVLIGVVSWGFTQWEAERAERNAWSSRITKLDAEIESRLDAISDMFGHEEVFMGDFNDTLWGYDHGIYEEFRKRDTRSLMLELAHIAGPHRRTNVKRAAQAMRELGALRTEPSEYDDTSRVPLSNLKQAYSIFNSHDYLELWSLNE